METTAEANWHPQFIQALNEDIHVYFQGRRDLLKTFVDRHLGFKECIEIQKRTFFRDFLRNPVNALWAIPSLSIRKSLEVSAKLGWDTALTL